MSLSWWRENSGKLLSLTIQLLSQLVAQIALQKSKWCVRASKRWMVGHRCSTSSRKNRKVCRVSEEVKTEMAVAILTWWTLSLFRVIFSNSSTLLTLYLHLTFKQISTPSWSKRCLRQIWTTWRCSISGGWLHLLRLPALGSTSRMLIRA